MPASGFTWQVAPDDAWGSMADAYVRAIHRGVYAICQKWAPIIQNAAQADARWTDRTANARQSLHAEVEQVVGQMVSVTLAHGVFYGWYLEGIDPNHGYRQMQNAGRWNVINPTIDRYGPLIWRDVVRMLS